MSDQDLLPTMQVRHVRFTLNNGRWAALQVSIRLSVYEYTPSQR